MRKILGARKKQLFGQFLGESTILALLAFVVALILVFFTLPYLNDLSNKNLSLLYLLDLEVLGGFFIIFLLTALLGGSYPAFIISNLKALQTIKGKLHINKAAFL